jgi:flagellin
MRASGPTLNLGELRIGTLRDAQELMPRLEQAHETVIEERNHIAAFQQRLEFSADTSDSIIAQMKSSEADIRDTDLVRATSDLTRSQIMSEVAASIAVEADVDIERILSLLQ